MTTAQEINKRLEELKATVGYNEGSGLMAKDVGEGIVRISDDYASGYILATDALAALSAVPVINWDEQDNTESAFEPVWDALVSAGLTE